MAKKYVTFEFTGCIQIEVEASTNEEAQTKAFEVIEQHNHKVISGFGNFEYHDGEVVDVSNQPT